MSDTQVIVWAVVGIIVLLIILYFYYNNQEVSLRKEATAQYGNIEAVRDRMFQILREQAGVAANYRDAFAKIYPEIISGRYQDGGQMMKWIQEANPNFDTSLYKGVMNSIEVQRTAFTAAQTRMLDIINQRETLIESFPSKWFVQNKSTITYTVISSTATKQVMSSGVDDWSLTM